MMTNAHNRRRQAKGTPIGGQFAQEARKEPRVTLSAPRTVSDLAELNTRQLVDLARTSDDPDLLTVLARHKEHQIRVRVATNQNTPSEVLDTLVDTKVGGLAAANPNYTKLGDLVEQVEKGKWVNPALLVGAARNPNLTPHGMLVLAKESHNHPDSRLGSGLAARPDLGVEHQQVLANHPLVSVVTVLAHNTNTSPQVLAELSKHSDDDVIGGVATNPSTPAVVIDGLLDQATVSGDKNHSLFLLVAFNPSLNENQFGRMHQSGRHSVNETLARNPGLTAQMIGQLLADPNRSGLVESGLVDHPNVTVEQLHVLAESRFGVSAAKAKERISNE